MSLLLRFTAPAIACLAVAMAVGTAHAELGAKAPSSSGLPGCVDPNKHPDKIVTPCSAILVFRGSATVVGRAATVSWAGASLKRDLPRHNAASAFVPNESSLRSLASNPGIKQIIPNRRVGILAKGAKGGKPGGGGGGSTGQVIPSGVDRIGAAPGATTATGNGIGIAIVDTGLDRNHSDLSVAPEFFGAYGANGQDDHGHGTHVGGIVAALNNSQDVVGVAPDATLYSVKVLDSSGFGSDDDIIAGLGWVLANAAELNIRVVNMSLGDEGVANNRRDCGSADWVWNADGGTGTRAPDNPLLRKVIQDLTNAGVVVVAAAGNDNAVEVKDTIPAGCAEVIAVASTSAVNGTTSCRASSRTIAADTASFFTTDGAYFDDTGTPVVSGKGIGVTVSAPGEKQEDLTCAQVKSTGILSLQLGGGTTRKSGTSMASPHVAGVVARILEKNNTLGTEDVRSVIRAGADGKGSLPNDPILGTPDGDLEGIVSAKALSLPGS